MRKAMLLVAGLVVAVLSFLATHSSAHTDAASSVDSFNDMTPAWSPDGTQIAFARELPGGGVSSIYVVPDQRWASAAAHAPVVID